MAAYSSTLPSFRIESTDWSFYNINRITIYMLVRIAMTVMINGDKGNDEDLTTYVR